MKYLIYDARFHSNPERATVLEICDSLKEAKSERKESGCLDSVIVECRVDGTKLIETGKTW